MNPAWSYQNAKTLPIVSVIRSDIGLCRDTQRLMLFLQLILWIYFCFSVKAIIFVRKFYYRKVFALIYWRSDKRKPTARLFRLHRLLYFIRAVCLPTPAEATEPEWEAKSSILDAAA